MFVKFCFLFPMFYLKDNTLYLASQSSWRIFQLLIKSNLDSSNTDDSFTLVNSNLILSPYENLPIALDK